MGLCVNTFIPFLFPPQPRDPRKKDLEEKGRSVPPPGAAALAGEVDSRGWLLSLVI